MNDYGNSSDGRHTGQRRLYLTTPVAIPDTPRLILLSEDSVPYLAEIFGLLEWRYLLNCKLSCIKYFAASNSVTKMHPYGVPFCWWLIDAKEKHRPYHPYRALGILINSIVDVFLADFMVCCSIGIVDIIKLDAYSEN